MKTLSPAQECASPRAAQDARAAGSSGGLGDSSLQRESQISFAVAWLAQVRHGFFVLFTRPGRAQRGIRLVETMNQ